MAGCVYMCVSLREGCVYPLQAIGRARCARMRASPVTSQRCTELCESSMWEQALAEHADCFSFRPCALNEHRRPCRV